MKKRIFVAAAVALPFCVSPVVADDMSSFHAMSQLSSDTSLTTMTDEQLASVEGGQVDFCVGCTSLALNLAEITQVNVAILSVARQLNAAAIRQDADSEIN